MPVFATYLYMSWYVVGVILWCAFLVNSTDFDLIQIRADDNTGVFVRMLQLADVRLYVHGVAGRLTEKQLLLLALGDSSAELDSNYKCLQTTSPLMKDQVCLFVYACAQCDKCDTYAYVHSNVRAYINVYSCVLNMRVDMHVYTNWCEVANQYLFKQLYPWQQCAHLIWLMLLLLIHMK